MDNRPIGVFDSGLGGLSVVREIIRVLPGEDIIYFGDTGRVPYGTRSQETIEEYARQDIAFLRSQNVKAVIAACGTVSAVASAVTDTLDLSFTGVVIPAAIKAAEVSENKRIGVLGTSATVNSGAYEKQITAFCPEAEVFSIACPLFVPLVENGFIDESDEITRLTAKRYLAPLLEKSIDTLILGCTHFPVLAPVIGSILSGVTLVDAGREAARYAKKMLEEQGLLAQRHSGSRRFFVSDRVQDFSEVAGLLIGEDISGQVEFVQINTAGCV